MKVKIKGLSNAELLSRIVDGKCLATGHKDTFVPQATWVAERLEGQKWLAEEFVRCKDCKYEQFIGEMKTRDCGMGHDPNDGDFFCADGECDSDG